MNITSASLQPGDVVYCDTTVYGYANIDDASCTNCIIKCGDVFMILLIENHTQSSYYDVKLLYKNNVCWAAIHKSFKFFKP